MADIFISYTSADSDWAKWIAQQLEKLGHVPHIHEWEISGGGNIMAWMEERLKKADHVLCVISNAYLAAPYSSWERQAAQWAAATKRSSFALPVFIEECEASLLFAITKRCDLHGVSEEDARARLESFMTPAAKPAVPVPFPGATIVPPLAAQPSAAAPRLTVKFPGKVQALSNIPIAVPRHFVGRDHVLDDIRTVLTRGEGRVAITTLHGLRGVGKTTLAAAYADKYRADYRATWWVRAQTDSTIRADLVALGVRLGWVAADEKEDAALATVRDRLHNESEGILLIFDNANNRDELRPYLPVSGAAQVLVTSNAPNWAGIAAPVQIRVWPKGTGADFFLSRVPERTGERAAAEQLSEALGGLPLAHEQAAAFCERLGLSFAEYLKRFTGTPAKLLDAEKDAPAEYHDRMTVAKTFALAIDEAAKLHPAAAPLIEYAAMLAPEPIPLFLFAEGQSAFEEPFVSMLRGDGLDEAIAALRALALIDRESISDERDPTITTDCMRLHRLVREMAGARLDRKARDISLHSLVQAMNAVYPSLVYDNPSKWPRARRLDAIALELVAQDSPSTESAEVSRLLDELSGYRQYALATYSVARALSERSLAIREKVSGPDDPSTAVALNNLANLLLDQGDLTLARPLFERALAIGERTLGAEHPAQAARLNNLGLLLRREGEVEGARRCYEQALVISEKVRGPEHFETATCLNNLGALLGEQGDLPAARKLLERALAIRDKVLGSESPWTSTTLVYLALLLRAEGNSASALPMLHRALSIFEKVLGAGHPRTKNAAGHTVDTLDALNRTQEATALREKYGI